jgi:hypothetical protein
VTMCCTGIWDEETGRQRLAEVVGQMQGPPAALRRGSAVHGTDMRIPGGEVQDWGKAPSRASQRILFCPQKEQNDDE